MTSSPVAMPDRILSTDHFSHSEAIFVQGSSQIAIEKSTLERSRQLSIRRLHSFDTSSAIGLFATIFVRYILSSVI